MSELHSAGFSKSGEHFTFFRRCPLIKSQNMEVVRLTICHFLDARLDTLRQFLFCRSEAPPETVG